jgi:SAM-dependent methyltransferase
MYTKSSIPYYEGLADDYDAYYARHYEHAASVLPKIVESLRGGSAQRILDVGAGTGAASIPLAKSGHTVVSLDNSERMLEILRQKIHQMKLQQVIALEKADIVDTSLSEYLSCDLEGADNSFDGVVFWGNGLCHIHPDDYAVFASNVRRLLKRDGWLLLDYRSGERMRSRGTHVEILLESASEIRLSCVHAVPHTGCGPLHRVLMSIRVSPSNGANREPNVTKVSFNSIWPYLVDEVKLREVLVSEGFSRPRQIDTEAPLSDMVTELYLLNRK